MLDTASIMDTTTKSDFPRIKLGVSACLLGEPVRYDGGHKRHGFLTDILAAHVDYLPVCPEAAIGMGTPRPPIQLVGQPEQARALGVENPSMDVTDRLERYARQQCCILTSISGYIFKKNSPSCGLGKVKLFKVPGHDMQRKGTGVYAGTLIRAVPLLPVTEEDCLDDPQRCSHFLERAYTYRRWQDLISTGITTELLLEFHAAHKYIIMTHSQTAYLRLGNMLGELSDHALEDISESYISSLMHILKRPSQQRQLYKVLQHITGDLEQALISVEQSGLDTRMKEYLGGENDISSITKILRALLNRHPQPGRAAQLFLHPYPELLQHVVQRRN